MDIRTVTNAKQTSHFAHALLPAGWSRDVRIAVQHGRIESIETDAPPAHDDERHAVALPGLPNLHSHAFQRGMAGLPEVAGPSGDSFWTWRETMYRFADRLTPDDLAAIAALAYVEMLESGFTRVGEFHYLHHDRDGSAFADPAEMSAAIASAAADTGIALTLLPVFYAHSGFGGQAPKPAQRRFVSTPDSYAMLLEQARKAVAPLDDAIVGVAPHSLRAATPEQLAALIPLAGNDPIHIHIAEQTQEVEYCLAWSSQRPIEWLLDRAPVDARWCLVHATHMTDAEACAMAASGAIAGLCPITEANLGDGIFPAAPFLEAGGRYGIGSDSNVLIDATEELRLLEYGQRLTRRERNILSGGLGRSTGDAIFRSALEGGAQALGAASGITIGSPADLVSLDAAHPSLLGRSRAALLDGLIFATGRSAIDCVWRRGRKLVSGGRHVDREAIVARYAKCLPGLLA